MSHTRKSGSRTGSDRRSGSDRHSGSDRRDGSDRSAGSGSKSRPPKSGCRGTSRGTSRRSQASSASSASSHHSVASAPAVPGGAASRRRSRYSKSWESTNTAPPVNGYRGHRAGSDSTSGSIGSLGIDMSKIRRRPELWSESNESMPRGPVYRSRKSGAQRGSSLYSQPSVEGVKPVVRIKGEPDVRLIEARKESGWKKFLRLMCCMC